MNAGYLCISAKKGATLESSIAYYPALDELIPHVEEAKSPKQAHSKLELIECFASNPECTSLRFTPKDPQSSQTISIQKFPAKGRHTTRLKWQTDLEKKLSPSQSNYLKRIHEIFSKDPTTKRLIVTLMKKADDFIEVTMQKRGDFS